MRTLARRRLLTSIAALFPIGLAVLGGLFGPTAGAHLLGGTLGASLGAVAVARVRAVGRRERLALIASWSSFALTGGAIGSAVWWRIEQPDSVASFVVVGTIAGLVGGLAAALIEAAVLGFQAERLGRTVVAFLFGSVVLLLGFRAGAPPVGWLLSATAYGWLVTRPEAATARP